MRLAATLAAIAQASGMTADTAPGLADALSAVPGAARVLVCGSLHLAGEALKRNGTLPQ